MRAKAELYVNVYKEKPEGFPVSVKVTHNRVRKYYSLKFYVKNEEQLYKPKMKEHKKDAAFAELMLSKAILAAEMLADDFTFFRFEKEFLHDYGKGATLKTCFENYTKLMNKDRIKTISSYECALNSFLEYKPKSKLADVTSKWLESYENWMLNDKQNSITSVGIYTRNLRAVVKKAISDGLLHIDAYPFGEGKYQPPTGKNIKKALKLEEIQKLLSVKLIPDSTEAEMRSYWAFIYLSNGVNVADICGFKWSDLHGDTITFIRDKSVRTKRVQEKITIVLQDLQKKHIERYGTNKQTDTYIFPYFNTGMSMKEKKDNIANLIKQINKYMRRVAEKAKIDKQITTYTARHSFSTIMQNSGAPVSMIGKMLGHASVKTTEAYLGSFEDEQMKKATKSLLKFKKKKG